MKEQLAGLESKLFALRAAFDATFRAPPPGPSEETEDFLVVVAGEGRYALRLADVAGLFVDKAVTPIPSSLGTLLGIAGFRQSIVAVHDLAGALGGSSAGHARWLALAAGERVAFAFAAFERYVRAPRSRVSESATTGSRVLQENGEAWPIVELTVLVSRLVEIEGASRGEQKA